MTHDPVAELYSRLGIKTADEIQTERNRFKADAEALLFFVARKALASGVPGFLEHGFHKCGRPVIEEFALEELPDVYLVDQDASASARRPDVSSRYSATEFMERVHPNARLRTVDWDYYLHQGE